MKKWAIVPLLVSQVAWAGNSMLEISQRCQPLSAHEKALYSNDFRWGFDLPGMMQKFTEIYDSEKRLPRRAYWDAQKNVLKLPYDEFRGGDIEINENFVQSIARHIERAFEAKYIDAVFFPDMGHSHLLIPQQLMTDKYDKYPVQQMSLMYQDMFKDSQVEVLYHTAEQLKALDDNGQVLNDEHIKWRHHTRNIVGLINPTTDLKVLQNPQSKANTVGEVPGYYWWGAGFNLSAQKEGCFEYRHNGRVYYFDLSMYDLEPDPNTRSQDGGY
ncbi:hypothetical protein [Bdellovibrio bacteriovorus]|uniref:hypothetical protein n=1 Tax=Bdellovibrio bacteriovorus TaxID=959 RepID=UPI0035A5C984